MDSHITALLRHAFARAPAREANTRIQEVRDSLGAAAQVRSYELMVPPDAPLQWLADEVLPRLVYHLESLGVRPPAAPGVFLSLFVGDELLFLHARDVFAFASSSLGLSPDEMLTRWGTGERRTAIDDTEEPKPVLALPGPEPR